MQFGDFPFTLQLRDIVNRLTREAVDVLRPRYRYGTVESIDRPNRKAEVIYNGDSASVIVNMGSIQPKEVGQQVRIEGIGTDKYIADIMGDNNLTPPGGGDPLPSSSTYMHTQSSAAATWTITHNLSKYPIVVIVIGGKQVYADIDYPSLSQATVTFPSATTGTAHLV